MSDIKSYFLLGGMLLLEYCRDCILNHCNGYGPISSPIIFVSTWNAVVILDFFFFFFFFFLTPAQNQTTPRFTGSPLCFSLSPAFLVTIKTIHKQTKFSSESLLAFRSQENDTRYVMLYSKMNVVSLL